MSWGYLGDEPKKGRSGRSTGLGGRRNPKPRIGSGSMGYRSATAMGRPSGLSGRLEGVVGGLFGPGAAGSVAGRGDSGYDERLAERDRHASTSARRSNMRRMREQMRREAEMQEEEEGYEPLSLTEAITRAMSMLGDAGSVNYDPERAALRGRASENDSRLEAMYRQLQGSYAADAPKIEGIYDEATEGVNENTDEGVANINAAYSKARADQTAQLQALGIEDAAAVISGAGQDAGAQQAAAVGALEQNRGANVNQLSGDSAAAGEASRRIGQAAGLEGNLQRAGNQSRLMQLLAEIDMAEQSQNAQMAESRRGQSFSIAQALVDQDFRNQQYRDSRADADFDKQYRAQQIANELQGETAARFDPQQAISATDAYFEQNGIENPTPDEWNKLYANMIRAYSVGY